MKYSLLLVLVIKCFCTAEPIDFGGIGKSVLDISKGIVEKIPDAILRPEDLFEAGKNIVAGYPFSQVRSKYFQ